MRLRTQVSNQPLKNQKRFRWVRCVHKDGTDLVVGVSRCGIQVCSWSSKILSATCLFTHYSWATSSFTISFWSLPWSMTLRRDPCSHDPVLASNSLGLKSLSAVSMSWYLPRHQSSMWLQAHHQHSTDWDRSQSIFTMLQYLFWSLHGSLHSREPTSAATCYSRWAGMSGL